MQGWKIVALATFIAVNAGAKELPFCETTLADAKATPVQLREARLESAFRAWRNAPFESEEQHRWMWVTLIMERVFTGDYNKEVAVLDVCREEFGE